jgi:ABC-type glutathione transport system ATPase component
MEDFLTSLYIENNYPAKAKLLQLAKAQRPEVKTKDVNDFLEAQMSYQLLKETKKLKSTTITITHDVKVMEKLADRVALLREGEVFWVDNLKNTVESEDEYVKLFLNK